MKTIIVGGYGNFGARICRALVSCPDIELIIAGRDARRAAAFAGELGAHVGSLRLDASQDDLAQVLRNVQAALVIHAAGPFQQQGYAVALAAAAAGAHYIDLADGRRFVCDFQKNMDGAFRSSQRLAITGASTVPALSSAVIDYLTAGWQKIDEIDFCIAPAQTAPRGVATMAAVLSYCGAPIQVWHKGAWTVRHGWANLQRMTFARLRPRLGALCDIPDLEIFPERYRGVHSVMFRAALEIAFTQRTFAFMAILRRTGWLKRPERFAKLLNFSARGIDFLGSSLGGMVVCVKGVDGAGTRIQRAWHITADDDHGPEIPCMAAILMAQRLARQEITEVGAHACTGWLTLADFQPEFMRWGMVEDVVEKCNEQTDVGRQSGLLHNHARAVK